MSLEAAMREQPVISNANAKAPGNPPQKQRDEKGLPRKHKKRCYRAYMECDHEKSGQFADRLPKRSVPLEKVHDCESPWWLLPACLFDSSLPAGNRADCNTCVIVGQKDRAEGIRCCPKVHTHWQRGCRGRLLFKMQGVCRRLFWIAVHEEIETNR
jgi:hypothetical protein